MCGFDKVFTALAVAVLLTACGADDDDDSMIGSVDGGIPADGAVGPLGPLASPWVFDLRPGDSQVAPERTRCDVMIGASGFDISCRPNSQVLPQSVGEGCNQLLDDLHLSGSVFDRLQGAFDRRVEYAGDGCSVLGLTTGSPYPLPVFATMDAERSEARPLGEWLGSLGGSWVFSRHTDRDQLTGDTCAVEIDVALGPPSLSLRSECPEGDWTLVAEGCEARSAVLVEAVLTTDQLEGELSTLVRHQGDGCDASYPAEVVSLDATLHAERVSE
jgi:hypothetical protein